MGKQAKIIDNHKILSGMFRALADHVSDNRTRENLQHIHAAHVDGVVRFEATDGFTLVRADIRADHPAVAGIAPGFYQPKQSIALASVGAPLQPSTTEFNWPATDQVIPAERSKDDGAVQAVNPEFLATTLRTIEKIAVLFGGLPQSGVRLQLAADALSPMRVSRSTPDVRVVGVIMPMRA